AARGAASNASSTTRREMSHAQVRIASCALPQCRAQKGAAIPTLAWRIKYHLAGGNTFFFFGATARLSQAGERRLLPPFSQLVAFGTNAARQHQCRHRLRRGSPQLNVTATGAAAEAVPAGAVQMVGACRTLIWRKSAVRRRARPARTRACRKNVRRSK